MTKRHKIRAFLRFLRTLKSSDSGASMLEYALLAFLIGVVLIGVLDAIGLSISEIFGSVEEPMTEARENAEG